MATRIQLGARQWVNHNLTRAEAANITSLHLASDHAVIRMLLPICGLSVGELERRGETAERYGCVDQIGEKTISAGRHPKIYILRAIEQHSLAVDGCMPRSDVDDQTRYMMGVSQGQHTCAIDSVLFVAVRLDIGRTQIDQLPLSAYHALPLAPKILRRVVSQLWGLLDHETRRQQRDMLAQALSLHPSIRMERGHDLALSEVSQVCFEGLPQLSYTTIELSTRCDGTPRVRDGAEPQRSHYHPITSATSSVRAALRDGFNSHPTTFGASNPDLCGRGVDCPHALHVVPLVLDRLPPILMVIMPEPIALVTRGLFDDVDFRYFARFAWVDVRYTPVGCVIHVKGKSHFIVRWRADRKGEQPTSIVEFDGMRSAKASYVSAWTSEVRGQSLTVDTLFYRRII